MSRAAYGAEGDIDKEEHPMRALTLIFGTIGLFALPVLGWPSLGESCMVAPDESAELSIQIAPGLSRPVYAELYENAQEDTCRAYFSVPLSAFPTSRLATRPADVARVLHELARKWETNRCVVRVHHENDTEERFAPHELCLVETFAFDGGRPRSVSRETTCWGEAIDG